MARGTLFLVVGPSGVGKDTLIDAARAARPDLLVPRRTVTRPAGAGGETIDAVDPATFAWMAARGAFLLHWQAHGLFYGVPALAGRALEAGRDVMVNVSRQVVPEARERLAPVRILLVTASADALADRLAARGRESAEEIAGRLARAEAGNPAGPDVLTVRNDGALEDAVEAFLAALEPVRG